tara:strand:- start:507 stop:761 length:255 start_codon:yes stop_codon:yes gene_type:complete
MSDFGNRVMVAAMFSSCNVEDKGGLLYYRGTSQKADGTLLGYYPKVFGFGKSDKVRTKLVVDNGELKSITSYDKSGNIINETID